MRYLLLAALLSLAALTASAQPYGHVNFGNLLSEMPEVKTAETELQTFEKQLRARGEKMVADYQARVAEIEAKIDDVTPKQLEAYKQEFAATEQKIRNFEQQMGRDVEGKRQELLGPIIQRAKDAVQAVAKEKGYTMVFDSSIFGTILFAEEMTDLLPLVQEKLTR